MLLFYVFYYLLSALLVFQGLHLAAEVKSPLGTLPEEVAQAADPSLKWGSFLVAYGALCLVVGIFSHHYEYLATALLPLRNVGALVLAVFGTWVIFKGRTVKYLGEPAMDQGHGQH